MVEDGASPATGSALFPGARLGRDTEAARAHAPPGGLFAAHRDDRVLP